MYAEDGFTVLKGGFIMETYKNLKKGTKIGLIITAVLLAAVLVAGVFGAVQAFNAGRTTTAIFTMADVVMCVLILLYAFFGYKKPHGNLLKLIFFVFAVYLALQGMLNIAGQSSYAVGSMCVLAALLIAYVAGRLNKIEKNKFILIFVGLLILARVIILFVTGPVSSGSLSIFACMTSMTSFITFAALSFAYIARYEQHKAAGLEDK